MRMKIQDNQEVYSKVLFIIFLEMNKENIP